MIPGYYAEQALKYWTKNYLNVPRVSILKEVLRTFYKPIEVARRVLAPPYGMVLKDDYDRYPMKEHIYLPFPYMTFEYYCPIRRSPPQGMDSGSKRFAFAWRMGDGSGDIGIISVYQSEFVRKGVWSFSPYTVTIHLNEPWGKPSDWEKLSPRMSVHATHPSCQQEVDLASEADFNVDGEVWVVLDSLIVMNLPKEKEDVIRMHTPSRLKAGMFRKNKIPVKDYRIVDCYMPTKDIPKANREAVLEYCYRGRTGPRRHMVRRSLRHLADGRVVWVREHERGNALKGEVETRYRVHGEKHTRQ